MIKPTPNGTENCPLHYNFDNNCESLGVAIEDRWGRSITGIQRAPLELPCPLRSIVETIDSRTRRSHMAKSRRSANVVDMPGAYNPQEAGAQPAPTVDA